MLTKTVTIGMLLCCHTLIILNLFTAAEEAEYDGAKKVYKKQPNIVIILADDMGFNDISFQGSNQIPTPNIDAIAAMGIKLNRMYVAPMCTPSRSAMMTGKYESNLGMQHFVIAPNEPYGLPLEEKTLPQYLKEVGYRNYLIGKWHLGIFEQRYTPLHRGFDSHFGYLGAFIDYWSHSLKMPSLNASSGFDMRKNFTVNWESKGTYATDLFTDEAVNTIKTHDQSTPMFLLMSHLAPHAGNEYEPMQAPDDEIEKFYYIRDKNRRKYAAMVSKLDTSIGKVVKALSNSNMLENTVILFMADNGAPIVGQHANSGSNFPFKGQKDSPWEGAVRSAAAIWSTKLQSRQRVSNQMIHITDWLPTLSKLAGADTKTSIDGKNVWPALSLNTESPRKDILCHHDILTPYMSYISGNYKYVSGTTYNGQYDDWLSFNGDASEENDVFGKTYAQAILASDVGQALYKFSFARNESIKNDIGNQGITIPEINELRRISKITCKNIAKPSIDSTFYCNATVSPCLFDLSNDPCEMRNLARERTDILAKLKEKVDFYGKIGKKPRNQPSDPRADPSHHGGIWTWWYDELKNAQSLGIKLSADQIFSCKLLAILLISRPLSIA